MRAAKNIPAITTSIFIIRLRANPIKKPAMQPKPIVLKNGIKLFAISTIIIFYSTFYQDSFQSPFEYAYSLEYRTPLVDLGIVDLGKVIPSFTVLLAYGSIHN